MVRQARDKKQAYGQNQNPNKGGRNIQKESPHNPRANSQKYRQGSNPRDGGKRKGNYGGSNEYQLPPLKLKGNQPVQPPSGTGPTPGPPSKKIIYARPEQVQETLVQLQALQRVLNSYEQLQMDKNDNIKLLVDYLLQKEIKKAQ